MLSELYKQGLGKISVVVPVYQAVLYLRRCVDSLVNQTYPNLEIILVDDGSTDGSSELCDELAKSDERIVVIHKENGGASSSRNAALRLVTGDYIAFVDSDDWISRDIYEKCLFAISNSNSDIVDFKVEFVTGGEKIPVSASGKTEVVEGEDILYDYLYLGQTEKCPFSMCRKLYRRELLQHITFPEGKVNEDIVTNFKILQRAKRIVHLNEVAYYYYQGNETSVTSGQLKKRDFDLLDASRELCVLSVGYSNKGIYKLAKVKLARSYFSLLARAARWGKATDVSKKDMTFLTSQLRKNYVLLLRSPMPINRKLLASLCCIDYRIVATAMTVLRR